MMVYCWESGGIFAARGFICHDNARGGFSF